MRKTSIHYFLALIFFTTIAYTSTQRLFYNWDMLPYMAITLQIEGYSDSYGIHQKVYTEVQKNLPEEKYQSLINNNSEYRKKMFADPDLFMQQLPMYQIKPLYNFCTWTAYRFGVPLYLAPIIPSLLAYIILGMLFYSALTRVPINSINYQWLPFILAPSILLAFPFIEIARLASPDALSSVLMFTVFLTIIQNRPSWITGLLLLVSILVRPDNLVFAVAWWGWLLVYDSKKRVGSLIFLITGIAAWWIPMQHSEISEIRQLFYFTFLERINDPLHTSTSLSLGNYLVSLVKEADSIRYSALPFFGTFTAVAIASPIGKKFFQHNKIYRDLFWVTVITLVIRYLLFPGFQDRFFVPYYLLACLIMFRILITTMQSRSD